MDFGSPSLSSQDPLMIALESDLGGTNLPEAIIPCLPAGAVLGDQA